MNVELNEFLEIGERGLREGLSGDAQVFDEDGQRKGRLRQRTWNCL